MPKIREDKTPPITEEVARAISLERDLSVIEEKMILVEKNKEDVEELKKHVCPFFKDGKYPDCFGCSQPEDKVKECTDKYLFLTKKVPAVVWSPMLERPILRERVTIHEATGSVAPEIGLQCSTCYVMDKCPFAKTGALCAIDWLGNVPRNTKDFYEYLITIQTGRVRRALFQEELDGGVADANVSGEIDRLEGYLSAKNNLESETFSLKMTAKSGSPENKGGGLLQKIFGDVTKKTLPMPDQKQIGEETNIEE